MNVIETKTILPTIRRHFLFIDTKNCSAKSIFERSNLHVKVTDVAQREKDAYQLVFCKVRRNEVKKFKQAMQDLTSKVLMCGYAEYESDCENAFKELLGERYKEFDCLNE